MGNMELSWRYVEEYGGTTSKIIIIIPPYMSLIVLSPLIQIKTYPLNGVSTCSTSYLKSQTTVSGNNTTCCSLVLTLLIVCYDLQGSRYIHGVWPSWLLTRVKYQPVSVWAWRVTTPPKKKPKTMVFTTSWSLSVVSPGWALPAEDHLQVAVVQRSGAAIVGASCLYFIHGCEIGFTQLR